MSHLPPISPALNQSRRNPLVDVLRGLSLLMVLGSHFGLLGVLGGGDGRRVGGRTLGDIGTGMGYYGVVVFFVISGFLITGLSLRRYSALPKIRIFAFWWLRCSRLMPMLLFCVLAMVAFHAARVPGFLFPATANLRRALVALFTLRFDPMLGNGLMPEAWHPLWSLSVEEMFYLFFPLVGLGLTGRAAIAAVFTAVIAIAYYFKFTGFASDYSALGCAPLLALGCLIALARPDRWRQRLSDTTANAAGVILGAAGAALIVFPVIAVYPFVTFWAPATCGVGAALVLVASQWVALPRAVAAALWPVTLLGVISYEAYLLHLPLKQVLELLNWSNLWLLLAVVVAAGWAAHRFFSEPLNQALRHWRSEPRPARWWAPRIAGPVALVALVAGLGHPQTLAPVAIRYSAIKALPAGTVEPVACLGGAGTGVLVFLRHENATQVVLGIDDWGHAPILSRPLEIGSLVGQDIRVEFDRRVAVTQGGHLLVSSPAAPRVRSGKVRLGVNDVGFSSALPKAASPFAPVPSMP